MSIYPIYMSSLTGKNYGDRKQINGCHTFGQGKETDYKVEWENFLREQTAMYLSRTLEFSFQKGDFYCR